jgi:hypothetical protein
VTPAIVNWVGITFALLCVMSMKGVNRQCRAAGIVLIVLCTIAAVTGPWYN